MSRPVKFKQGRLFAIATNGDVFRVEAVNGRSHEARVVRLNRDRPLEGWFSIPWLEPRARRLTRPERERFGRAA